MTSKPYHSIGGKLSNLIGNVPEACQNISNLAHAGSVNGRPPAPLHLWNPQHCGDLDMVIRADGTWIHEGVPIRRKELWQLFAGILRREKDGHYYLVTPVEKCRVQVALHPLIVTDIDTLVVKGEENLVASLNAGGQILVSDEYPIRLETKIGGVAYIVLDHGLSALFSRAAWYRLVDFADAENRVRSAGASFALEM